MKPFEVGDQVVVSWGRNSERLDTVSRVTKTQVILAGDPYHRHRRDDGYQVGNRYASSIRHATPVDIDSIRTAKLARKLANTKWAELSLAFLERIAGEVDVTIAAMEATNGN